MKETRIDYDVTQIRKDVKTINPNIDFDLQYLFYYDETNNPRKFFNRENGFNSNCLKNFIVGGICIPDDFNIDFSNFLRKMNFNKNLSEIKFKNIATGNFLDCLKSQRLYFYLQYLIENNIYVHYLSVNLLYWSIVDIIDSIKNIHREILSKFNIGYYFALKNELYKLIKNDIENVRILFHKYEYPNINSQNRIFFIGELKELLYKQSSKIDFTWISYELIKLLELISECDSLIFIEDEQSHMLLEDFSNFYLKPIYMFNTSKHIFDIEPKIIDTINTYRLLNDNQILQNFSFEDSKSNVYIQLSDIFVGLLGKLKYYFNTNDRNSIRSMVSNMQGIQYENIVLLSEILYSSVNKNPAFVENIDAQLEIEKMNILYDIAVKNL